MSETFAFDLETTLIRPGMLAPKIVCGSWANDILEDVIDEEDALWFVYDHLKAGDHLVGANIAYDMACILEVASSKLRELIFSAYDNGQIHDVQIRQALNAIAEGHLYNHPDGGTLRDPESGKATTRYSLSVCALLCLGQGIAKKDTWRLKYGSLLGVPLDEWPEEAITYPKQDARTTYDVFVAQRNFKNLHDEPAQCRAALALHLASCWGLRTDPEAVAATSLRVREKAELDTVRFKTAGLIREDGTVNTKTLKLCVTAAYENLPPLTDKGAVRTDRDTLAQSGDPLLEAYAKAAENKKLMNSYLGLIQRGTRQPINPSYTVLMETGRTSSSNPSIQQLPRKGGIRECFKARSGYCYAGADYTALELATLAQACRWLVGGSVMADRINEGRDLHTTFAAQIMSKSYEQVLSDLKDGDPVAESMRQSAKFGNLGIPGGMGPGKLAVTARKAGLSLCTSMGRSSTCGAYKVTSYKDQPLSPTCLECIGAAEELRRVWLETWPEMKAYFKIAARIEDMGGTVEQLVTKRIRGGCTYSSGANTLFQGLAADGAKHALWLVTRAAHTDTQSPLYNSRPAAFIHDEIVAEVPTNYDQEALSELCSLMVTGMRKFVPDVAIRVEGALTYNLYKGAKPVLVDGRVVPSKPIKIDGKTKWVADVRVD